MKLKFKLLTTLILGTLSLPGHSRVYEYTIKDIYGAEKSVSAETGILNTNEKNSVEPDFRPRSQSTRICPEVRNGGLQHDNR